jgi:hypothetical protein
MGDNDDDHQHLQHQVIQTTSIKEVNLPINEHWFKAYWRPAMAWIYAVICVFDFIIFPATSSAVAVYTKQPYVQWMPLTLQGGGLIHIAFGAILGIYAYGRTQEKLENADSQPEK